MTACSAPARLLELYDWRESVCELSAFQVSTMCRRLGSTRRSGRKVTLGRNRIPPGQPRTTPIYKMRKLGIENLAIPAARPIPRLADEPCHAAAANR